jgi:hypothetical protein
MKITVIPLGVSSQYIYLTGWFKITPIPSTCSIYFVSLIAERGIGDDYGVLLLFFSPKNKSRTSSLSPCVHIGIGKDSGQGMKWNQDVLMSM